MTRTRAGNFYHGLKLTPEPRRSAMYAVYAFMRACDDLTDEAGAEVDAAAGLERIERFRATMQRALDAATADALPAGALWPAFHHVVHRYGIDTAHLHAMLDGQRCDVLEQAYASFDELYAYCYRVASVVGLVCLSVWGYRGGAATRRLAEQRGVALQLTNILRDVAEDAQRGRVYLPADELARFDVTGAMLRGEEPATAGFDRLMRFQIERARGYYRASAGLERAIEPGCRGTSWAMMEIYRRLLERIARRPRDVLQRRVRLGTLEKLAIACQATWRGRG
ncbi:MAG: phytoene/squalene synthase family protein [Phycisphaeraceae bacterium]